MESNKTIRIFAGATAIVTGGASGIGRAFAMELARRQCHVIVADLQIDLAEEVVSEITRTGGSARAEQIDVTDWAGVEQLVQTTHKRSGRLDYIFNNAGIHISGGVEHYSPEDWNLLIDINLRGVIHGVQAAYPIMVAQGFGHIINTSSIAGLLTSPGSVGYSATKFAVVGLSKSLRVEAARKGIKVSVLCPGVIRTPLLKQGGKYGKQVEHIPAEEQNRIWESLRPMDPAAFARCVIAAVAKNKAVIIAPAWWRLLWWMARLTPALETYIFRKAFENTRQRLGDLPTATH